MMLTKLYQVCSRRKIPMTAKVATPLTGKLILLDLDGAALLDNGKFSVGTSDFLREARAAGNHVAIVTARYVASTIALIDQAQGSVSAIYGMHGAQAAFWDDDGQRYVDSEGNEVAKIHRRSDGSIDVKAMKKQAEEWAERHGDPKFVLSREALRDVHEVSSVALTTHVAEHNARYEGRAHKQIASPKVRFAIRAGWGNRLEQAGFVWRDRKTAKNSDERQPNWEEMLAECTYPDSGAPGAPPMPALKAFLDPGPDIKPAQAAEIINRYCEANSRNDRGWQIRSGGHHCEIFHQDLGKEHSTREAQQRFEVAREDCYYLGDAGADVSSMKLCGHALIPRNGTITLDERREIIAGGTRVHRCSYSGIAGPEREFRKLFNLPDAAGHLDRFRQPESRTAFQIPGLQLKQVIRPDVRHGAAKRGRSNRPAGR